jgi:hypothetical protein
MEVNRNVGLGSHGLTQPGEVLTHRIHEGLVFDDPRRALVSWRRLEGGEALPQQFLHLLWGLGVGINSNFLPGGAAQQFINRNSKCLTLNVP